jgi:trk system potassium uptake protein TrkH
MKVGRVIIVLKYVHAELIRSLHPKAVITIKMADKVVRENTVRAVVLFVQLYIMIFILATLIFSITESSNPQFGALSAISAAACSLGIIGPGFGVVAMDFNAVSDGGKILAVFCMYIGRLEILPVVLMFLPETWSE